MILKIDHGMAANDHETAIGSHKTSKDLYEKALASGLTEKRNLSPEEMKQLDALETASNNAYDASEMALNSSNSVGHKPAQNFAGKALNAAAQVVGDWANAKHGIKHHTRAIDFHTKARDAHKGA